jgi:hypothetical protein
MPPTPEVSTYQKVKNVVKIYPSFTKLFVYDEPITVKIPGYEELDSKPPKQHISTSNLYLEDSIRRTKTTISDLTICNEFDLWTTFTFNCQNCNTGCKNYTKGVKCTCPPNQCKRSKPSICKKRMSKWLNNQRETHGNYSYLIVPEYHKKHNALHFHALMKDYKGQLTPTNKTINKRKVYNIKSYQLGFSTAVKIDNIDKVSSYIKKYITKDMPLFPGKKRYWCNTGLQRPVKITNPDIDPFTMEGFTEVYKLNNLTIFKHNASIETLSNKGVFSYGAKYRSSRKIGEYSNQEFQENWKRLQTAANSP